MLTLPTAVLLSLDALALGFVYGINGIRLTPKLFMVMNGAALGLTCCAYFAGRAMDNMINETIGRLIGSVLLTGIGIYIVIKGSEEDCGEEVCRTSVVTVPGALMTGAMLSADAAAVCAGLAVARRAGCFMPFAICIVQGIFMLGGIYFGGRTGRELDGRMISLVSGFAVVLYGLYELTPVFC